MKDDCIDDDKLIADIERYGWAVILIEATDYLPSFGYTVGLWKNYSHPELICFGLKTDTLYSVLNDVSELIKAGAKLQINQSYTDFFENASAQLLNVETANISDYFGYAIWFNKTNFNAFQIVWPDRNNKFPWESNFEEEFNYKQPLLDRNVDFKFREEKNLAVFTTRQWIELKKPVLRVVHDVEGDWQFLTGDQIPEDIRIVALKEMVLRDQTLNQVFNLEYGESAERKEIGGDWVRSEIADDD